MVDKVSVCNAALQFIGAQATISSIDPPDGSQESNVAALFYQPRIDALHRTANWNFSRRQVVLTQLKTAISTTATPVPLADRPPAPFLFEYEYPVDCLRVRYIPNLYLNAGTTPALTSAPNSAWPYPYWQSVPAKFVVGNDTDVNGNVIKVILTDQPQAQMVYTARIEDPNLWDAHFYDAACATLAAWFVNALARNRALMNDMIKIADAIIAEARRTDGDEGLTNADHIPDWQRVRGSNAVAWGGRWAMSFDAITWPDGQQY